MTAHERRADELQPGDKLRFLSRLGCVGKRISQKLLKKQYWLKLKAFNRARFGILISRLPDWGGKVSTMRSISKAWALRVHMR